MDLGLAGRVALVTGGSRGIGFATARALLAEGASVVVCGRDADVGRAAAAELGAAGGDVVFVRADVASDDDVAALVAGIGARWGRLDVVVNNAGRFGGGDLDAITTEQWHEGLDVKAVAASRMLRHARPWLTASGQGRVVNVSGVSSRLVVPGVAVTALANAAMTTLTAYQAQDLRDDGVAVSCVVPGYILSGAWRDRIAARAEADGTDRDTAAATILAERGFGPGARWGTVDEVAAVIVFLASGPAGFVSGATLQVDGAQMRAVGL